MDVYEDKFQPEAGTSGLINSLVNITECCRVCMSQYLNMHHIFKTTKVNSISEKINYCTGLQVTESDKLPMLICDNCLNDLLVSYKFKTVCLRSQTTFEQILNTTVKISYSDAEVNDTDNIVEQNSTNEDTEDECNDDAISDNNSVKEDYEPWRSFKLDLSDLTDDKILDTKSRNWVHDKLDAVIKRSDRLLAANKIIQEDIVRIIKPEYSQDLCEKISTCDTNYKADPYKVDPQFSILQPSCDTCNIRFRNKKECAAHNKEHHPVKEQWVCEICGSVLSRQTSFYVHRLSHGPYTFSCKLCDYKTWYKGVLEKHMRSHDGLKLHQCKICLNKFSTASGRNRHMRTAHGGEKRYACETCGKAFYDRRCLKLHIDSHDNIKRFTCEICQTQFTRRGHWRKHKLKQHGVVMPRMRPGRKVKPYMQMDDKSDDGD